MRILVVHPGPDFSVADVYAGWTEALQELGCETAGYNLNDRLIFYSCALIDSGEVDETGHPVVRQAMSQRDAYLMAMQGLSHACYTFWPDVILFISGFFMTDAVFGLLRQRRHKVVILHTECPYQDDEQIQRGQMADLNFLNDAVNLSHWRQVTTAEYMPHAYRPSVHYPRIGPRNAELASDVCFIGTAFKSRIELFEAIDWTGIDLLLGGSDWGSIPESSPLIPYVGSGRGEADCVDNPQAAELYRNARTGLNYYRREAEDGWDCQAWAMGPREVEMAATGLFFLRDPRGEGDEVFKGILPTFDGPGDASEKLRWWLARDSLREKRAAQAREAVADRTFQNNARRFLQMIEKL